MAANEAAKKALEHAREMIKDPHKWCQNRAVGPGDSMCASQAYVTAAVCVGTHPDAWAAMLDAADKMGFSGPVKLNDSGPPEVAHPRVLEMFDRAIETVS